MLSQTANPAYRDLAPAEIIRLVKERFRIYRYLLGAATVWIVVGAFLYFFWLGFDYANPRLQPVSFVLQTVGYAALSIAIAVKLAIYRCPVCDVYLGRKLKDKLHCPRCNAQVRE
jgi:hypothetical protein